MKGFMTANRRLLMGVPHELGNMSEKA